MVFKIISLFKTNYSHLKKGEEKIINLDKFTGRKDVRILQEVIYNTTGKRVSEWVNKPECDCKNKVYLTGPELDKYIREHGAGDLCVGPKGGVYVPADKFKSVGSTELESNSEERSDVFVFDDNKNKSSVNVGYFSIKVDSSIANMIERFLIMEKPRGGNIDKFLSIVIKDNIDEVAKIDITDVNPKTDFIIKRFGDKLDGLNLLAVISFLNLPEKDIQDVIDSLKFVRATGILADKQSKIHNVFMSGLILNDFDELLDLYKKFWNTSDVNERRYILGDILKKKGNVIVSLNAISLLLAHNFSLRPDSGRSHRDSVIVINKELYDKYFNSLKLDSEHVKRIIVMSGLISRLFGVDADTAVAISKGIMLFGFRMSGAFSTNAYYIDEFLKRFVFGNGRPSRTVSRNAIPVLYMVRFLRIFKNPGKEVKSYHTFVKHVAKEICGGDECEVVRSFNMGESMFLSRNIFIAEILDEVAKVYGKDSIQYKKVRDILSKYVVDKIYGYTMSTSLGIGAEKMLENRGWMGGVMVKFKVPVDNVVALPLSADSRYLDDVEFTVLVPKEGFPFEIVRVGVRRNYESFDERIVERIKNDDFVMSVLYSRSSDIAKSIKDKDTWADLSSLFLDRITRWYTMEVKMFAGIDKTDDYYQKMWKNMLQSLFFAVDKWWLVSRKVGVSRDDFNNFVKNFLSNKGIWEDVASLRSASKETEVYNYGREELKRVRSPYLKDFPKFFKEAVEEYVSDFSLLGFGGDFWHDIVKVVEEVW